jgi:crotonobetainyl-CoA:carnitine CoA-transferase CaiB-like acyl-CoA transferase
MLPLDDVRVLDLTHYTIGPFCTRVLADYGADVVKIERPGGDPARLLPPFPKDEPHPERSGTFLALNTGKRSVVLDLKHEEGRRLFLQLVAQAQIVVENFAPGTLDRLGVGYEVLRAVNPRLVLTSISNFGQDGPYRDWEGTDLTLYGMGGPMIAQGMPDREPVKTGGRAPGYQVGYAAALASAVGLLGAERRGSGEHLDVSAFEVLAHSIDSRLGRIVGYQHNGRLAGRTGGGLGVGSGTYPCLDGFVLITSGAPRLHLTIRMIERPDLLEQPEWATIEARAHPDRVPEFDAYLLPWTLEHTREEIRAACQRFGVLGGPLNTTADLLEDPNFVARGFFQTIDHPETGPLTYPGFQARIHTDPMPERRRAPLLGEHTVEVLRDELGVSTTEWHRLQAAGVAFGIEEAHDAVAS